MKNLSNLLNLRLLTILVTLVFGSSGFAQKYDTLHLNYHHTATTAHDTTQKRIDAWVKKLNKQHVDVKVYAYYHKPEFKKFAEQRIEDMFIVLNRKARDLITIQEMTSKKGKDFQRTMVDIIYTVSGSKADADKAAAEEKAKKEVAEKEKKANKEKEVAVKQADKEAQNKSKSEEKKSKGSGAAAAATGAAAASTAKKTETQEEPEEDNSSAGAAESADKTLGVVLMDAENAKTKVGKKGDPAAFTEAYNTNIKKAFQKEWDNSKLKFIDAAEKSGDIIISPSRESKGPMLSFIGRENNFEKPFRVSMIGSTPQVADFLVLAHKVKIFYGAKKEFDRENLTKTLEGKTLYITVEQCDVPLEKIKAVYPYPVSIVSQEEFLGYVNGRNKNALYVRADDYEGTSNILLISAESGTIIARAPGALKLKTSTLKDLSNQQKQTTEFYPLTIY